MLFVSLADLSSYTSTHRFMEAVEKFLALRRSGDGEAAFACLSRGASLGSPWGGMHRGPRVHDFLTNEPRFVKRGYLEDVPIQRVDENTYQRTFTWDRGMGERGNTGYWGFGSLPKWREVYYVQDGHIRLVTAEKLRTSRNIWAFLRFITRTQ